MGFLPSFPQVMTSILLCRVLYYRRLLDSITSMIYYLGFFPVTIIFGAITSSRVNADKTEEGKQQEVLMAEAIYTRCFVVKSAKQTEILTDRSLAK